MTYQVVGCSTCQQYWIAEDLREQQTVECPLCFTQHQADQPRIRFEHDERKQAAEKRSRILAEQAGKLDAYQREGDYAELADRLDDTLRFREEYLADAASRVFEDHYQRFGDAVERAQDRWESRHEFLEAEAWDACSEFYDRFADEADAASGWYHDAFEEELDEYLDERWSERYAPDADLPEIEPDGQFVLTRQHRASPAAAVTLDEPISRLSQSALADGLGDAAVDAVQSLASEHSIAILHDLLVEHDLTLPDTDLQSLALRTASGSESAADTFRDRLQYAAHGRSTTSDTHVVADLFAMSDYTPLVEVELVDGFWDLDRSQREDICAYLGALARGCDVRLVASGIQQLDLYQDHREDLPVSRDDVTPLSESRTERVARAKAELARDGREVEILRWLASEDSATLSYSALYSRCSVDNSRVRQSISRLAPNKEGTETDGLGLVDTFGPHASKHVELLPAGRQFLDWLDEEIAQQQTLQESVSDVCNGSEDSRVTTRAHVGGGTDRHRLPPLHTTQHLSRWDALATAASTPENGISVVDYPLEEQDDQGSPRWHYADKSDTLVVGAEATNPMQYWVCIARALAGRRTFEQVLEDGDRIDETEDLGEFLQEHKPLLRDLVCMGYLPDDVEDGSDYVDELDAAEDHLCELTKRLAAGEYESSVEEYRSTITREAMGLSKTMFDLLDLAGVDVVQQFRLPRQNGGRNELLKSHRETGADRTTLVKLVTTAVKLQARAGLGSVYRQLFEQDESRREAAIEPSLDAFEVGELVGSICVVGEFGDKESVFVEELRAAQRRLDDDIHEDAPNLSVRVPTRATDDLPRQRFGRAVERMAAGKNLRATREAVSLLRLFVATPFDAAKAIAGLRSESEPRDLRVSEVRVALSKLDDARILPWESRGVQSLAATLLEADRPLSGTALAERAGVSRRTWQSKKEWLLAMGLVRETEQGYRLTVAFSTDEERYHDERRPWFVKADDESELPFVVLVRSLGHRLATELLDDEERSEYFAAFRDGPRVDEEVIVECWPRVARWLDALRDVTGDETDETPEPVVFGQPDGQLGLGAAVSGGASA